MIEAVVVCNTLFRAEVSQSMVLVGGAKAWEEALTSNFSFDLENQKKRRKLGHGSFAGWSPLHPWQPYMYIRHCMDTQCGDGIRNSQWVRTPSICSSACFQTWVWKIERELRESLGSDSGDGESIHLDLQVFAGLSICSVHELYSVFLLPADCFVCSPG